MGWSNRLRADMVQPLESHLLYTVLLSASLRVCRAADVQIIGSASYCSATQSVRLVLAWLLKIKQCANKEALLQVAHFPYCCLAPYYPININALKKVLKDVCLCDKHKTSTGVWDIFMNYLGEFKWCLYYQAGLNCSFTAVVVTDYILFSCDIF